MDDLRKEQVNTFIANAENSSQAPLIHYDAFSGKRVRPGDEFNLTLLDVIRYGKCAVLVGLIFGLLVWG